MHEWHKQIQLLVDEMDYCIKNHKGNSLTLPYLSRRLGYSKYYTTKQFKAITGLSFRDYLRLRKLAFALKEVRDRDKSFLTIALDYGFSSHEAFTRAFKSAYGMSPSEYRSHPRPVVLRTKINPFDRYFFGYDEIGMVQSTKAVKVYFVTIPAHQFLHIRNYESNGYWDFRAKQNQIPGQDMDTVCGLFDSIKGKLDDDGGSEANCSSGQIMAYINDPAGRLCDWGYPRIECFGVRLPMEYSGTVPAFMQIIEIPKAEYIVFEHGPFDYEQENRSVEAKIEKAMSEFDFTGTGYCLDTAPGRILYFYYNPEETFKYIRPIRQITE